MAKPFHPGKAAYDGVLAAIMAGEGFTCQPNILEGRNGFLQVMGAKPKIAPALKTLGQKYLILDNTFKPYAACLLTHPTIYGLISLKTLHEIDYREVDRIECEVSYLCIDAAGQREPKTGSSAKFSVYFCAALALAEGEAGEDKFDEKWANESRLVELARKVRTIPKKGLKESQARVTVFMKSGEKYSRFIKRPKGDTRNPMGDDEIENKFRALACTTLSKQKIEKICRIVWNLEKVENMSELIKLCY
jgi:2-methylcitrate dehydratase PrpD